MAHLTCFIATLLVTTVASAHPGHGQSAGLVHYLSEPIHVFGAGAIVIVGLVGFRSLLLRRRSRQLQRTP